MKSKIVELHKVPNESLDHALRLARTATQDNPGFAIVDAKRGYARYPTEEERLLGKWLLHMYERYRGAE